MRLLFLVSDGAWSARGRAFVLAARGLSARGHDVQLACEAECPMQVAAASSQLKVASLTRGASTTGATLELRRLLADVDVCFVHTEGELMMAASAAKLGAGRCAVIRRVPPFCAVTTGAGARLISRLSPTGLLFSTAADREAADASGHRLAAAVAPLGIDVAEHDAVKAATRATLNVPPDARLIVCVHDGVEQLGVLTLLRTVALLSPRHPELRVVVIGAERAEDMRMHAAALGVSPMVTYLGPRDDELGVIRAADFGWIAANADAAALAALDFMASRIPVLAPRIPLTEHYIADGVTGVLLPPADPTTTAGSISAFLARTDSHAAMGNAGRARLQREFSFEAMIRGYEEAIGAATGARGARSVA